MNVYRSHPAPAQKRTFPSNSMASILCKHHWICSALRQQVVLGAHVVRLSTTCTQAVAQQQQQQVCSLEAKQPGPRQHQQQTPTQTQKQQQQQQQTQPFAWPGLTAWRAKGVDLGRSWGEKNRPDAGRPAAGAAEAEQVQLPGSLVEVALLVLNTADPNLKAALAHRGWKAYSAGHIYLHPEGAAAAFPASTGTDAANSSSSSSRSSSCGEQQPASSQHVQWFGIPPAHPQQQQHHHHHHPPDRPARPAQPELVVPKQVPSPKDSRLPLSAHLLHNLAHIELNAVDLAMDTVARFSHLRLPDGFYEDFARVADDEARHFGWCVQRMAELGHRYGDMVAHDLLWEGAQASAGNLAARLAIVPMSQEARGLDAGQRLATRLVGSGDNRSASIVNRIAEEERAHVAVGVEWFGRVCLALGVDPPAAFRAWVSSLGPELLKGPFNHHERQLVGLHRQYYDISSWPQELQQAVVKPAVAAAAKGKGLQPPVAAAAAATHAAAPHAAAGALGQLTQQQQHQQQHQQQQEVGCRSGQLQESAGAMQQLMHVSAVPNTEGAELEALRQRLWAMLQTEAETCDM